MTHYDRLGVRRDATADELRAAYRRAARAAHPDRNGDGSAAAMAAVNEAWRVLGDPVRRAAYDHDLAAADEQAAARPTATTTAAAQQVRTAPSFVATPTPGRFPWRFLLSMTVVGILVVVIGHAVTQPADPAAPDGILHSGECVALSPSLEASEVACDGAHDAVVDVLVPFDAQCPTGTEPFRDRQGMGVVCVVRRAPGG